MTHRTLAGSVALAALALGTAWLAAPARAGDPVKDLVKKVEARYQKTTDLTAEFSQTTDIKGFAKPLQSSGRVYIKRPGKLRWDYLAPTLEQIFVDNDKVQFYKDLLERGRSEEHTSELQSRLHLVCRLLLEKKKKHKLHHAIEDRTA